VDGSPHLFLLEGQSLGFQLLPTVVVSVTVTPSAPTVIVQQPPPVMYSTCGYANYDPHPMILANAVTSCSFAMNVADSYLEQYFGPLYNATVTA
jgi:hypothetical protein